MFPCLNLMMKMFLCIFAIFVKQFDVNRISAKPLAK